MRTQRSWSAQRAGLAIAMVMALTIGERARGDDRDDLFLRQGTFGVIARVGIEDYPVGCKSAGTSIDQTPWVNASGSHKCSIASQQDNVDGITVLVRWGTLQPNGYYEPLNTSYIDNAIYSLAHPWRQHIHLGVVTGKLSPDWLIHKDSTAAYPDKFTGGTCKPSEGGPSSAGPGTIWNEFSFAGALPTMPMPNPFGSNTCFLTALDNLVYNLGRGLQYNNPTTLSYPQSLAPYDNLYYESAPGRTGFVHTYSPTPTMNKIVGHVSALGPASYDEESVLCQKQDDCETASPNYSVWRSLYADDFLMEAAIESAQKKTIDIYAQYFPNTYFTVDLVERQMPFFQPDGKGCRVPVNQYPPTSSGNDASDCFGKLRTNLIDYIQAHSSRRGGVQNNSLGPAPDGLAQHSVWKQTALAAQAPRLNPVRLFVGFQVGQPLDFYLTGDKLFGDFEADDQTAVNRAKQMLMNYGPVDFIEFYDVDITSNFTLPPLDGSRPPGARQVNIPNSAINDAPNGVTSGGFMYVPLTDAHYSLPGGWVR
jgi:hypothetical protein